MKHDVLLRPYLVAVLLSFAPLALAAEAGYRLAGIVAGPERAVALIELPDGRQRLYHRGDVLGTGSIGEITAVSVRIELADEDLLLRLRGNPRLPASPSADAAAAEEGTDVAEQEADDAQSRRRDHQLTTLDMERLLAAAGRARQQQGSTEPPSAELLRKQLNELLELPEGAQVVAVDQVAVGTPHDAMEAVATRLERDRAAYLTLTGAGDLETVVLHCYTEE